MAVSHVFLLVLVIGIVHHSHGRTYESESITMNGSTDTLAVKAPSNTTRKAPTFTPRKYEYDYFSLVLQWPESFCSTGGVTCISPIPHNFTVHGLWPQLNYGRINCNSAINLNYSRLGLSVLNFSQKKINVLDYMKKYWPNLILRRNNDSNFYREWLWDHEYQEHGSCFWPFRTKPRLYFRRTVEMAMQIGSVTDMLLHRGIRPDNRNKYDLAKFENAIFDHFRVIPRLRCNARGGGIFQFHEIEFCFTNDWALTSCSSTLGDFSHSNCGYSPVHPNPVVMFPPPL